MFKIAVWISCYITKIVFKCLIQSMTHLFLKNPVNYSHKCIQHITHYSNFNLSDRITRNQMYESNNRLNKQNSTAKTVITTNILVLK